MDSGGGAVDATDEATAAALAAAAANGGQLVISSDNQQQLVLSAEDAAQLLAQAGIQLGDNEQVIVGGDDVGGQGGVAYLDPNQLVAGGDQQQVGLKLRNFDTPFLTFIFFEGPSQPDWSRWTDHPSPRGRGPRRRRPGDPSSRRRATGRRRHQRWRRR